MRSPDNARSAQHGVVGAESKPGEKTVPLWNNLLTMAGLFLTATAVALLLTFGLFSLVTASPNPYGAIVAYLVIPATLVIGIVLIPLGIFWKSWRLHRRNPAQPLAFRFPHVDLADPKQRAAAKVVVFGTLLLVPVVGLSAYQGYQYTDTTAFCGKMCHSVMNPQATSHRESSHAQVACTECHIGSRKSWFVKSKLSGMPQVAAVLSGSYPRPIPPGITDLRPTRDTCTHCHWPAKFFGSRLRRIVRFASDEQNTRRRIDMLLRIGGYETTDRAEGIHAHMALADRIEYVAADRGLREIPWIKYTDEAGTELIYRSDGKPHDAPRPPGELRRFDCMDCHNRPAHLFRAPQDVVDLYLSTRRIDPNVPYIKREAVAALLAAEEEGDASESAFEKRLMKFYRTNYADRWGALAKPVSQAAAMLGEIYRHNFFDDMNVDWRTYENHIGHLVSPGCFRCHDDRHVNQRGEVISRRCDQCHRFLNPKGEAHDGGAVYEGDFVHSFKLGESHTALQCDACHDGGVSPLLTCSRCHEDQPDRHID